jgi:hypothetical protein
MKRLSLVTAFILGLVLILLSGANSVLSLPSHFGDAIAHLSHSEAASNAANPASQLIAQAEAEDEEPQMPFDQLVKKAERLEGLFTLYRQRSTGKLYAEIQPEQLNLNYLCTVTLEGGIGQGGLYSGMPLADMLFTFRRVNNKLQFVVPNVYFRTRPDDPLQSALRRSFSDSVLQALPIKSIHPQRKSLLIDLGPLFLTDFPGLSSFLGMVLASPYTLDASKSHFSQVKAFPLNVELESTYGFSTRDGEDRPAFINTLPDGRSFNLKVRYSLSRLPVNNGYRPRLADERVGYFITAYQDLSDDSPRDPFVRYINRWHLEKQDPTAPLSPAKQPIVFWIENTVPLEYRDAVRDGVLMWNQAFEQAGFQDAIVVKQMPKNATWDPADVRYNTIRWLASFDSPFLGVGPSRVNPLTGEILDADILIDAGFSRFLKRQYRSLAQRNQMRLLPSLIKLTGNPNLCSYGLDVRYLKRQAVSATATSNPRLTFQLMNNYDLCYGLEAARQFSVGAMALTMMHNASPGSPEIKQYVQQFLRMLVAHEVGHTLGLRHNFRGSTMLLPTELNNPDITRSKGLSASVMDYSAVNLAPEGTTQGDYFSQVVGPYDRWAIAYGYTPSNIPTPQAELRFLEEIARRAPEPDLAYATDEDTFSGLDPQAQAFDLSGDLLSYAPQQLDIARQMWQRLDQRYPGRGESFNDVRVMFDEIFTYYYQYANSLTSYIGGQSFNRFRGGDASGRLPFEPVAAQKQRQALTLLNAQVFAADAFRFPPGFINKLAPSRWWHWGEEPEFVPLDYPIYDRILLFQSFILGDLLSYDRLTRLRDAELRQPTAQTLTIPELFSSLQTAIWQEMVDSKGTLHLSSLRRGLQREYLNQLADMVLRRSGVPDDARTLAWYSLKQLRGHLDDALRRGGNMDLATRAHLEETRDRILKTLDAQLQSQ